MKRYSGFSHALAVYVSSVWGRNSHREHTQRQTSNKKGNKSVKRFGLNEGVGSRYADIPLKSLSRTDI